MKNYTTYLFLVELCCFLSLVGAATSIIFVATKHLFCRDETKEKEKGRGGGGGNLWKLYTSFN